MDLFLSFLTAVLISVVLIPVLIRWAGHLNLVDEPGDRKVHAYAIPRCGGLGLAIGALTSFLFFIPYDEEIISLIVGGGIIVFFGLLDDRFELDYKWKFAGQFLAVIVAIYGGVAFSYLPFMGLEQASLFITLPITVLFGIGVTNAVNLSDGLDGLAAGIMLMTLATITFLALIVSGQVVALMTLAVAGGIVGFLWFNTHPAVVFMGDTGSQFIGYMAVFLSIYLTQNVYQTLNPALPLLLLGLPILDTLLVMVGRIRRGISPFSADKTHIHHRLLEYGLTHAEAVGTIYVIQGVFLLAAFNFRFASDFVVLGAYFSISFFILVFFYWAGHTNWLLRDVKAQTDRRGAEIWRSIKLFHFARKYIAFSVASFLLLNIACLINILDETITAKSFSILLCCFVIYIVLPRLIQDVFVRISVYISSAFSSLKAVDYPGLELLSHWLIDVFLLALIIVVSIAVRITRKANFRMTTQDVLVVLFVMAAVLLMDVELIGHIIFRLFCLAYALEYLLNRDIYAFRVVRFSAIISGMLISMLMFPGGI